MRSNAYGAALLGALLGAIPPSGFNYGHRQRHLTGQPRKRADPAKKRRRKAAEAARRRKR